MARGISASRGGDTGIIGKPLPYVAVDQMDGTEKSAPPPEIAFDKELARMTFICYSARGALDGGVGMIGGAGTVNGCNK